MVEWVATDSGFRVFGRGGNVTIRTTDWTLTPPELPLPYPADTGVTGRLLALELDQHLLVDDDDTGAETVHLDAGEHVLRTADDGVRTALRTGGPAILTRDDGATLHFNEPAPIAIAVSDPPGDPDTVRVPRSPAGVAAAVTVAGDGVPPGPDRSFAPRRPHPPLIEFDDGTSSPETPETGPVFSVPDDLETVLVAAPLAYYLGARLRVGADAPIIQIPATGFEYAFSPLPAFASEVAAALRRVVLLDCCARQTPLEPPDRTPLAANGLAPDALDAVAPGIRYAAFLDADIADLPEWHLSAYVDAGYDRARALPTLLDRLALIYPAEATEMEPEDLLTSSLDDFYRGVVSVTPVAPELGVGQAHAWLADGEVVDAFKTSPAAYEHARRRQPTGETLDVTVILNDPGMDAELSVAGSYRACDTVPLDVTIRESLSTAELAATLEDQHDFLHYIGHCDTDGLRCSDGCLSTASLDRSGARAFFLNACGSYHEGEELVAAGSIAGAVTLEKVLNEQAAAVGTAFGRLVVAGYGIDRALSIARRRVMMGKDYAVVGDGTATVAPSAGETAVLTVDSAQAGFDVTYEPAPGVGSHYADPFETGREARGEPAQTHFSSEELIAFLQERSLPVVFDGELNWSDDLEDRLVTSG